MRGRAGRTQGLTIRLATVDDLGALHETAQRAVFKSLSEHYSLAQLNAARP